MDGYDITMNSLNATLSNPGDHGVPQGHLWITGQFTVHLDCWPDPDISFHGPVFLTPDTNPDGTVVFTAQAGISMPMSHVVAMSVRLKLQR